METQTSTAISNTVPAGGAVGIPASKVSSLAVLLSFAVARLAGAIPVTPGGLGTVDAAFIGILTYLIWKRGVAKGRYAKDPDLTSSRP